MDSFSICNYFSMYYVQGATIEIQNKNNFTILFLQKIKTIKIYLVGFIIDHTFFSILLKNKNIYIYELLLTIDSKLVSTHKLISTLNVLRRQSLSQNMQKLRERTEGHSFGLKKIKKDKKDFIIL
ncbi:hypothetical protein BpHYR1_050131 [Brachionus plicatilis]|uniref:Uncharacterized protein n=1 Tax=Brachionus plicatilis TaxID=10195 RepID=A0A3M7RKC3_BRAPC|nr:hypothetical protein BpHYR1_050131 [Brachionus plicatilis]